MSSKSVTRSEGILTNTVKQAAARTGLSERTLWDAIAKKTLRATRVGGRVLIPEESLRKFLGMRDKRRGEPGEV
jgi:excisionase family DNA binding protein